MKKEGEIALNDKVCYVVLRSAISRFSEHFRKKFTDRFKIFEMFG